MYKSLREKIDSDFARIYDQAGRISDKVDVQPVRPCMDCKMEAAQGKCP